MAHYQAWEWVVLGLSIFLTVAYHAYFRRGSTVGAQQAQVLPVWAYIHEQSCKQSILMIQLLRNMMSVVTALSAITLGFLMMLVRMKTPERKWESVSVSILCSLGFVAYVFCATIIGSLVFNIALYPTDLSLEVHSDVVTQNRVYTREQLKRLSRHYGIAKRLTFISMQYLFLLVHPVALLVVTCASLYMWHYLDTRFGVRLGGINLSLLSWGITPSTLAAATATKEEGGGEGARISQPPPPRAQETGNIIAITNAVTSSNNAASIIVTNRRSNGSNSTNNNTNSAPMIGGETKRLTTTRALQEMCCREDVRIAGGGDEEEITASA